MNESKSEILILIILNDKIHIHSIIRIFLAKTRDTFEMNTISTWEVKKIPMRRVHLQLDKMLAADRIIF